MTFAFLHVLKIASIPSLARGLITGVQYRS